MKQPGTRSKEEAFLQQLRATFKIEAQEHLQTISAGLLELEKTRGRDKQLTLVETVFRAAHSLKGAARAVDFTRIESLCQSLEDVFATWKREKTAPSAEALDALHRTLDAITSALAAAGNSDAVGKALESAPSREPSTEPGPAAPPAPPQARSGARRRGVQKPRAKSSANVAQLTPVAEATAPEETVRIAVAKLEARLLESEEMLTVKLTAGQRVADLRELASRFESWRKAWLAVEPDVRALRQMNATKAPAGQPAAPNVSRLLDFFDAGLDTLKSIEHTAEGLGRSAEQDRHTVSRLVDDLLEDSKKLLLLPFSTISASFPKVVRDLCRDQEKEADLTIHGDRIEIDKRILEEMKDPVIHLLRNSIDHGIEAPPERTRRGKPSRATITLAVSQVNGNKVQLLLSDDGAGIDTAKVRASAIESQAITRDEANRLDEADAKALIFRSGVSTSASTTQLSGRGLGLAIVREKTEKMGGQVSVESHAGMGTTFRIVLPATRATFRGILVEAAGRLMVIPTAQVERVSRARPDDVHSVEGRETISLDGCAVSLVRLADALELPHVERNDNPAGGAPVIVVNAAQDRVAFVVDAVLDEQEVLVKLLRKPLSRVRNVAAATVLGTGQIVPILNVADLLKSARKLSSTPLRPNTAIAAQAEARRILVVDDSITSRMLLKSILESAGYAVTIAVDGLEAFTLVRAERFDLVVSDVEMPRLDGFDLTARIRADPKLAKLPVVLVTARETREDREHGIGVGASAYLVKSSFDQSDLLGAVRRLI